jgi:hypothetical protein
METKAPLVTQAFVITSAPSEDWRVPPDQSCHNVLCTAKHGKRGTGLRTGLADSGGARRISAALTKKMAFVGGPRQVGKTTLALSLISPDATERG